MLSIILKVLLLFTLLQNFGESQKIDSSGKLSSAPATVKPPPAAPTPGAKQAPATVKPPPASPTPGAKQAPATVKPPPAAPNPGAKQAPATVKPPPAAPNPGAKQAPATVKPPPAAKQAPFTPTPAGHKSNNVHHETAGHHLYVLDPTERFCYNNPKHPFYQRYSDGAICCRGKQLPVVTIPPEIEGPCAISTKTGADGILDSEPLWCSYTCSLKKLGLIDKDGKVVAEKFFTHLSQGLTPNSQSRLKAIMENYLGCFKPLMNTNKPCYTALGFQKCYRDALIYLCAHGMPKNNDFTKVPKIKAEYEKLTPFCYYNQRRVTPGCCHGKPLPWTITEILEASRNATRMSSCLADMGEECDATCLLQSLDVVNEDFDLDVDKFEKNILKHFPTVKPSSWMDYTGPVFLFYDEVLVDMGDEVMDSAQRVCRFHDRVMELHESKVEQYCEMTGVEVKQLLQIGSDASTPAPGRK